LAALVAALLTAPLPVLDEESYLAIAAQFDPSAPYDWWRPWPPWNGEREVDAFVYAHPPLYLWWVWMWTQQSGVEPEMIRGLKVALALPWAALLGWSMGFLAERYTRRHWMACIGWLATPITLLGLQRGLMPDLMLCSLSTLSLVGWTEACRRSKRGSTTGWWIVGGVALGLAGLTKYPALLMIGAFFIHARATGRLRASLPFWASFCVVWMGVEIWLWSVYGRPHLWEVLTRAQEIPRGSAGGRALGTATRLALGVSALFLLPHATRRGMAVLGSLTVLLTLWGMGPSAPLHWTIPLAVMSGLGVVTLAMLAMEAMTASHDEERVDLLLGSWGLLVVLGVVIGHNFSAPRYLLPVMVPVAIIGTRVAERVLETRLLWWLGVGLQGVLALAVTHGEHRFAEVSDDAALRLTQMHPGGGVFTGEWTFRWRMEHEGWTFFTDQTDLPWVAVPVHSSPAELPQDWVVRERLRPPGEAGIRVVCAPAGIGLYGETIGPLPIGWSPGVLEEVELWSAP